MEAPKSFMVENEQDSNYLRDALRCSLCFVNRKSFHCANCITTGDFKNSMNSTKSERLNMNILKLVFETLSD